MHSAVCTLFEGDYHLGLGALVNSLYRHGFRGAVWAGYRGAIPPWAGGAERCDAYTEYIVAEGCCVRFVPVRTERHLTNFKPDFMLALWERHCPDAAAMFYFDPDICVKCGWAFYENWASFGVGLCEEIINRGMPANHPLRMAWKTHAAQAGLDARRELSQYFNGGFVGVRREHRQFLQTWQALQDSIEAAGVRLDKFQPGDRTHPFYATDQDVLNLTAMVTACPLSTIGPEGMDFVPGGFTMSHAVGSPKPWRKRMLLEALRGKPPSAADKGYLENARQPIRLYSDAALRLKRLDLRIGAAVGRFVRRA